MKVKQLLKEPKVFLDFNSMSLNITCNQKKCRNTIDYVSFLEMNVTCDNVIIKPLEKIKAQEVSYLCNHCLDDFFNKW